MDKKQRVINCLEGRDIDRIPYSFSKHFPADFAFGEVGVQNHLSFYRSSGTDIMKIMNEHLMPCIGKIERPEDWLNVKHIRKDNYFITLLIDFIKRLQDELGNEAFYLLTLHGVIACCIHISVRQFGYYDCRAVHAKHLRENPQVMKDVHSYLTELLIELINKASELKLDGIYYSALGGDNTYLNNEEFSEFIAPYDKAVLEVVKAKGMYSFLHMCKDHLQISRYDTYNPYVDVVNWGVYENGISLKEGATHFPDKTLMGGFSNSDKDLLAGNAERIVDKTQAIIGEVQRKTNFILAADCTCPTFIDDHNFSHVGHGNFIQ